MEKMKSGFVNVIGRPNVGKSSFLNALFGQKLAIVTNKPQTTRKEMKFIYTDEKMQVVFRDTPGVQMPKNKLGKKMLDYVVTLLDDADINLYILDNSMETGRLDSMVLDLAKEDKAKKIALVNKADLLSESERATLLSKYKDMGLFDEIVFVSALTGEGLDAIMPLLGSYLEEGPMYYDEEMVTDVNVRAIAEEIIREKCLLFLDEEIPHGIMIQIDTWDESEDRVDIEATLYMERENHKAMIIGKQGAMIKKILHASRQDLRIFLEKTVTLSIVLKVRKNWRKNGTLVDRWF